jgi:hypothetical protein
VSDMPDTPGSTGPAPLPAGVSASARERAVELLTRGFADDRVSESELEALLDRVYAARTMEELEAIASPFAVAREAAPEPGTAVAAASAVGGALARRQRISAFLSGQGQRITGVVPAELQIRSRLGYVELDLRDATFQPGVTVIDVRALMGYVEIHLPAHVRVESEGRAVMGYFSLQGDGAGGSGAVVRITGRATLGYAECFVERRRLEKPGD